MLETAKKMAPVSTISLKFLTLHFVGRQKELNGGCPDKPSVKSGGEEEEESVEVRVSPSLSQFTFREQNNGRRAK